MASDKTLLVKDIAVLATLNDVLGDIKDGAIYCKGNVIQWVGKTSELPAEYQKADTVLSMEGKVVIPGLICTHHHMYETLTRGLAYDDSLFGWLKVMYPVWANLTAADVYLADKVAMAELLMSGCTTAVNHHLPFPNDVRMDDGIRAAKELGMRYHPVRGILTIASDKGGLAPPACAEDPEKAFAECERLIATYHDPAKYSMLRMNIGPATIFEVEEDIMVRSAQLARKHPGVRLHTHLAENQEDIDEGLRIGVGRPKDYMAKLGWMQSDVWCAHCCKVNDEELGMMAAAGVGIAHCPSSNLRLASGIANVRKALDTGVNVGLGVDGSCSNDCGNMIQEVRMAMLVARHAGRASDMPVRQALALATKGGAVNLGRADDIGQLAPGYAADFVAWKAAGNLGMAGTVCDPVACLVLCMPGNVDLNVVNGRVIIKDGKFTELDLEALLAEHAKHSAKLMKPYMA